MNAFSRVALAVAAASWLLLSGCATLVREYSDEAAGSDERIAAEVAQRLRDDPVAGQSTYGVTVENGVVTLRGAVPSDVVRARVKAIARSTPGVVSVVDGMSRW